MIVGLVCYESLFRTNIIKFPKKIVPLALPKLLTLGKAQINLVFHSLIRNFAPLMMKRRISMLMILLANMLILAHAVILHHDKVAVAIFKKLI